MFKNNKNVIVINFVGRLNSTIYQFILLYIMVYEKFQRRHQKLNLFIITSIYLLNSLLHCKINYKYLFITFN